MIKQPLTYFALLLTVHCAPAFAESIYSMQVYAADYSRGGSIDFLEDGNAVNAYAGGIKIRLNGKDNTALCVDLFTNITIETVSVNLRTPDQVNNGRRAAWLYSNYLPTITTVAQGEGLQMAIWDIVHDNGDGPNSGRVRTNSGTPSDVVTYMNSYIAASDGQSSLDAAIYTSVNGPTDKQQLIGANFGSAWPDAISTPEPGAFYLVAGGMLVFGMRLRRRGNSINALPKKISETNKVSD